MDISDPIYLLNHLFRGDPSVLPPVCQLPVARVSVPDTGQATCYDEEGKSVECTSNICPGQDGFYSASDCPAESRFVDSGDGTVTDSCTGLMWQKEMADTNGDGKRDAADLMTWCSALTFCDNVNFGGHDDWRLPNVRELQSLIDFGRFNPAVAPVFGGSSGFFWSSTSSVGYSGLAWGVEFGVGSVGDDHKDAEEGFVRAVRSGQ